MAEGRWRIAIECGANHTVALFSSVEGSVVYSWGQGEDGQLGLGDNDNRTVPCPVDMRSAISRDRTQEGSEASADNATMLEVACGAEHTFVILSSDKGPLACSWGEGDFGRLGNGQNDDMYLPQPLPALSGVSVRRIACGDSHCMALLPVRGMLSFGNNQFGQLGLDHTNNMNHPTAVPTFDEMEVVDAACGAEHTVAVTSAGRVYSWGWGCYGNLGLGDLGHQHVPQLVPLTAIPESDGQVVSVACGWRHSGIVTANGALYTCGWAKYGQLGHSTHTDHTQAFLCKVEGLNTHFVTRCVGGWRHTMAVTREGKLYAWGWNRFGQLGLGHTHDVKTPTPVLGLESERVIQVACGWRHTVAVTSAGHMYSWGRGASGQLGHGNTCEEMAPKRLELLDDILAEGPLQYAARNIVTPAANTIDNSISMEVPEAGLDVPQGQTHKRQRLMEVPERASLELVSNVELHSEEHPRGVSGF